MHQPVMMAGSMTTAAAGGSMEKKQLPLPARACLLRSRRMRASTKAM